MGSPRAHELGPILLETGARDGKLKVYEMVDTPRAQTGYLLARCGVHQVAYARALELITGAHLEAGLA